MQKHINTTLSNSTERTLSHITVIPANEFSQHWHIYQCTHTDKKISLGKNLPNELGYVCIANTVFPWSTGTHDSIATIVSATGSNMQKNLQDMAKILHILFVSMKSFLSSTRNKQKISMFCKICTQEISFPGLAQCAGRRVWS